MFNEFRNIYKGEDGSFIIEMRGEFGIDEQQFTISAGAAETIAAFIQNEGK